MAFKTENILDKSFIILSVLLILSPKFDAIDNNAIRWTLISLNTLIYLSANIIYSKNKFFITKPLLIILTLGVALLLISINTNSNFNEALISSSKILIALISFICFVNSLSKIKSAIFFVAKVFAFSLIIESSYTIVSFFNDEIVNFTGISMNRNISAFSIAIKIPLLIFLRLNLKSTYSKLGIILEIISVVAILFLQSRGALLSIFLMYLFLIFNTTSYRRILFPFLCSIIISYFFINNFSSLFNQKAINPITLMADQSFNQRINYYQTALSIFKDQPLIGHGLGSWKVISLEYIDFNSKSLIVPYYVHNDILQFLVEVGLVGMIFYLAFLLYLFVCIKKKYSLDNQAISVLQVSFLIFFLDSNLNFPIHRTQELIPFLILCSLSVSYHKEKIYNIKYLNFLFLTILLLSGYVNYKENKSLIIQDKFLLDYYTQSFEIDIQKLENIDYEIPNLASNTVPISSYMARYYLEDNQNQKALELLEYALKSNPFDILTKELLVNAYLKQFDYPNSFQISEDLFLNDPKNEVYAEIYFYTANKLNFSNEILKSDFLNKSESIEIHKLFYKSLQDLKGIDKARLTRELLLSISKYPNDVFFTNFLSSLIK